MKSGEISLAMFLHGLICLLALLFDSRLISTYDTRKMKEISIGCSFLVTLSWYELCLQLSRLS